ncbi:MAG: YqaJ viral recombinase family protein [Burkholderiaceae bacterium]|jgi:putative phage-type endonuclease|nr:YqaJ viral recombinase family protein [Burkholderiaceae bacterium]
MQIHNLTQGSQAWLQHRAAHHNASDAPAMLGVSPHRTRTDLLHEAACGLRPEATSEELARYQRGHRFEQLARPLAEQIIGEELAPLVGSQGPYSASFDGLTLTGEIAWEHKTFNDELRACLAPDCDGADLPEHYRAQLEQQCLVSGCQRVLFTASQWSLDGELIEMRQCWYTPDPALRRRIVDGWAQFERDLAGYTPQAAPLEAVGRAPQQLPALRIEVSGQVTASNLDEFRERAIAVFEGINTDLQTEQDFADAEKTTKWCKEVEDRLEAGKQAALAQTASIDELFRTVDALKDVARQKRLTLEKLVRQRKEEIRAALVTEALAAFRQHTAALQAEIGTAVDLRIGQPLFGEAIKGLKTLASIREAIATALANGKIEADARARDVREKLAWLAQNAVNHRALLADLQQLIDKPLDDFERAVTARIEQFERQRAEQQAKAQAENLQPSAPVPSAAGAPSASTVALAATDVAQPPPAPAGPPTLRLGKINEYLAPVSVTADGLTGLGFPPAATDKSARLYHAADFPRICDALVRHIYSVTQRVGQEALANYARQLRQNAAPSH